MSVKYKPICICAVALLAASVLIGGFLLPRHAAALADGATTQELDIYLIGGQSNAAGYSNLDSWGVSGTFDRVMYAGEVNNRRNSTAAAYRYVDNFSDYRTSVTTGLGSSATRIGPEFGMAEVLQEEYSSGKKAMIFKSAAGGTTLRDIDGFESIDYGNWYPRSLWNGGFTPNDSGVTGLQYHLFVENFRTVYTRLTENGFTPKVKAMVWLQGESDLGYHVQYKGIFKRLIADFRADLQSITGDATLSAMPFIVSEIAPSFSVYNNSNVPPFNAMYREVANELDGVYTVSTADFTIAGPDGTSGSGTEYGSDRWHYNARDMRALGKRLADKALEVRAGQGGTGEEGEQPKLRRFTYDIDRTLATCSGASSAFDGETLSVKIVPKAGVEILSVKFNDAEMTYDDAKGVYKFGPITEDGVVHVALRKTGDESAGGSGDDDAGDTPAPPAKDGKGCGSAADGVSLALAAVLLSGVAVLLRLRRRAR